jgi:hypothetical protein
MHAHPLGGACHSSQVKRAPAVMAEPVSFGDVSQVNALEVKFPITSVADDERSSAFCAVAQRARTHDLVSIVLPSGCGGGGGGGGGCGGCGGEMAVVVVGGSSVRSWSVGGRIKRMRW